ncbi:MAG: 3'-5' exonuclease [Myxococcota bacterium]
MQELIGSMKEYEEEQTYADEPATVSDYLTRVSLLVAQDTMEDAPRVLLMTIHAAKGLEFDRVFLTGLEERLFPLRGQEPGEEAELEEERRLAYVAITRARKKLCLTHTNTRTIYGSMRYNQPSRFLADVPPAHQDRAATEALQKMSRAYGRGAAPSHRDFIRAGSPPRQRGPMPTRPRTAEPVRNAGERYVEPELGGGDDWDGDEVEVRVGTPVRHPKFGIGRVQALASGSNPVVTVRFDGWGDKRIKLSFLRPA